MIYNKQRETELYVCRRDIGVIYNTCGAHFQILKWLSITKTSLLRIEIPEETSAIKNKAYH